MLRLAGIILLLLACVPLHMAWRFLGRHSPWPRRFLAGAGWCAGARVQRVGTPIAAPCLYIANHLSWIDVLILAGATDSAFVAKAEMEHWPLLGWMADLNDTVYVSREARLEAHKQAVRVQNALKSSKPLTLFPEGTTTDGRAMKLFRSSLLAAVSPPPEGVAVQPVAIDYGADGVFVGWTMDESVGQNALRILARPGPIRVTLHFLEPLADAVTHDRKRMAQISQERIGATLCIGIEGQ